MFILPTGRRLGEHSYKLLLPQRRLEWAAPSLAQPKDQLGNENQRRFSLTARTSDGLAYWRGWFDDREDFDAFLFALHAGSLIQEPALWDIPRPAWHPDLGELPLVYYALTQIFIVTGTSSTSPSDWPNASNTVAAIGGGGSGGAYKGSGRATGGGGAEYRASSNFSVATPGTTTFSYVIGQGGASVDENTASAGLNGNNGTDTTFNSTTVVAKAGQAGTFGTTSTESGGTGGTGGTGAAAHNDGGRGGNMTSGVPGSTGGGGAGGPTGAGGNGTDTTGGVPSGGGAGDGGSGGSGGTGAIGSGTQTGGAGGNGTEFDATHGSGGGGGNGSSSSSSVIATGGAGGNYGAGGGGGLNTNTSFTHGVSGVGIQGIVYLSYTPITSNYVSLERGIRGTLRGMHTGSIH